MPADDRIPPEALRADLEDCLHSDEIAEKYGKDSRQVGRIIQYWSEQDPEVSHLRRRRTALLMRQSAKERTHAR
jgi:hypothetical protein